ncbi:MAG: thiamine phosphate synthase [Acidobacteriota bacterium]|nr:MAG: thiamine phosphate synthase [Acidobacteriota bacterium]
MSLWDRISSTPFTYLITPGILSAENFDALSGELLANIAYASEAGVTAVQIREKRLPSRLLFELTSRAMAMLRGSDTLCLVNERFDIALAAGVDGVHLTSNSIPVSVVRRAVPNDFIIGVSTHTLSEVAQAREASADLAVFGPVFETAGKPAPENGDRLAELRRASELSGSMLLLGLGGIDETNFRTVIGRGADGIAGISVFADRRAAESVLGFVCEGKRDAETSSEQ